MLGFSKKRFFITLGLSVAVWVGSAVIHLLAEAKNFDYGFFIFARSCEVTGYPLARCIPEQKTGEIILTYFINILFWFWVIHFFWRVFKKGNN